MQFLWMPYIRFTRRKYQEQNVPFGPVILWPDADATWQQLGIPRPNWLNIYREFPKIEHDEVGEPCRGSLVVAPNAEWLTQYHKRLASVLYFVGDQACYEGTPRTGRPAECFYARILKVEGPSHELVQLWTKHGPLVEDERTLKMTPPLAVRRSREPYFLDLDRVEHNALVALLFRKPEHRLITACLHYFLAQMADPIVVSFEQDYANYCACLEAAFDLVQGETGDAASTAASATPPVPITTPSGGSAGASQPQIAKSWATVPSLPAPPPPTAPSAGTARTSITAAPATPPPPAATTSAPAGIAPVPAPPAVRLFDQFVGELVFVYGDSPDLRDYARGLYTCRSIHDHGLSDFEPEETQKYRHQAYLYFLSKRGNYSVCRAICRDIVLQQLWKQPGGGRNPMSRALGYSDFAGKLLRKFFLSEKAWLAMKTRIKDQAAGKKIGALTGDDVEAFRQDVVAFVEGLDWHAVDTIENKDILKVIKTMLMANAVSVKTAAARPDAPSMEALGNAYDDQTDAPKAMSIWTMEHEERSFDLHAGDRTELIIATAWKAASFFVFH